MNIDIEDENIDKKESLDNIKDNSERFLRLVNSIKGLFFNLDIGSSKEDFLFYIK